MRCRDDALPPDDGVRGAGGPEPLDEPDVDAVELAGVGALGVLDVDGGEVLEVAAPETREVPDPVGTFVAPDEGNRDSPASSNSAWSCEMK